MLLSETVGMKDWEATGWEIRPYHFAVIEAPPPADYIALQTPKLDELNPIGGFSLEAEQGARKAEEEALGPEPERQLAVLRQDPQLYASKIPNAASLEAIEQTRTKEGLISYNSVDDMMADLFGDE
jgi:hypothetical protein